MSAAPAPPAPHAGAGAAAADSRLGALARVSGGALRGVAVAAGSAIANYVGGPRGPSDGSPLAMLSSAEVLRVASTLGALLQQDPSDDFKLPELPQLVVVGTQSSGKSSLLNAIMACDLLPLGESMVTRCPLHLQLVHAQADGGAPSMRAEFGSYETGSWRTERRFPLTAPNPTASEIAQIRAEIDARTVSLAGPGKCVSSTPIHLRIYSPHVPDLSLVDLPGLTQMALTAQGQPSDIKQQIRDLVQAHIGRSRTVILAVMPARVDLEADAAIELVKQVDPRGERTIGVLTKVDLMNQGSDVSRYLLDDGSFARDLRLELGYFAVRNRSTAEVTRDGVTVEAGFEREAAYFQTHPVYGQMPPAARARLGVPSLARAMSRLLVHAVHTHLPAILTELAEAHTRTQRALVELSPPIPAEESAKLALAQSIVAEFCRDYVGALMEKRADVRTGRRIKDAFVALREQVHACEAISKETFPDDFIASAVKDCEGNHLSFPIPPIEVLEQLLQSEAKAPIRKLLPPCIHAADEVRTELRDLCEKLCDAPSVCRFPVLRARIREELVGSLLARAHAEAVSKLGELVAMEEGYISTSDPAFAQELNNAVKKLVNTSNPTLIRDILRSYFQTVQRSIADAAPKAIMLFLVNGVRARVHTVLFEQVMREHIPQLLAEPEEMCAKRGALESRLRRLNAARAELEQCCPPSAR